MRLHLLDYASIGFRDIRRQRVRSSLTIIALAISTVIVVAMASVSIGGRRTISTELGSGDSLTTIVVTPNQSAGNASPFGNVQLVNNAASKLTDNTVAQLARVPHVSNAVPESYIWEFSSFSVAGSSKQFVAQTEGVPGGAPIPLTAGSNFSAVDSSHDVILGLAYADELGYSNDPGQLIGKTVTFTTQKGYRGDGADIPGPTATAAEAAAFNEVRTTITASIVGVTAGDNQQNSLFVPMIWAHQIRMLRTWNELLPANTDQIDADGYTSILVQADSTNSVKTVSQTIDHLGFGEVSTLSEVQRLQQFATIMWVILGSVGLISVIVAALGVVNTMLMSVSEQRYAIGIWRACGARKNFIARLFLFEAAFLGFLGGIIGTGIGLLVTNFINRHIDGALRAQGLSVTTIAVTPVWLLASSVGLTVIFGIVAGLYPAIRAARQDPSSALSGGQ